MVNVGKYTNPMDLMGVKINLWLPDSRFVSLHDSGGKITFSYRYTTRSIYTPMPEDSPFCF